MTKKRSSTYLLFTLFLLLAITSQQSFSQKIAPETLVLTIYPDGFVLVEYTVLVDPTFPTQNITVFGQVLEDLLVINENGLPLEYFQDYSNLSIYSLGADEISITYLTQDLTSKDGRYWTLKINAPTKMQIILPNEAVIISLNKVPEMIETNGDKVVILMNASFVEITYVVGVVGTEEHAQILLEQTETIIMQIRNSGIIITDAETKLQDAENAFSLRNFAEAEILGNEAKNLALQINQTAFQAQSKIAEAENTIIEVQNKHKNSRVNEAQDLLNLAKSEFDIGYYSEALSLATQAITEAEKAEILLSEESEAFPFYLVIGVIVVPVVIIFSLYFVKSRNILKVKTKKKKRNIDSERIFRENKDLITEEKQAIQFLAENNGEAFEAQLYDYVKLPRTTTWRMVKRLKRMGIITITKFRRQNLVRLKNKYDIKE